MDKEVKKFNEFKDDYKVIKSRVKVIKKKLRDLKKETYRIVRDAGLIHSRGNEMYTHNESAGTFWIPKFSGLDDMMDNLECFIYLDNVILRAINDIP